MVDADEELWPLKTVKVKTGMSRSYIYREMKAKRFPERVLVGGAARWPSTKIRAWIDARVNPAPDG